MDWKQLRENLEETRTHQNDIEEAVLALLLRAESQDSQVCHSCRTFHKLHSPPTTASPTTEAPLAAVPAPTPVPTPPSLPLLGHLVKVISTHVARCYTCQAEEVPQSSWFKTHVLAVLGVDLEPPY